MSRGRAGCNRGSDCQSGCRRERSSVPAQTGALNTRASAETLDSRCKQCRREEEAERRNALPESERQRRQRQRTLREQERKREGRAALARETDRQVSVDPVSQWLANFLANRDELTYQEVADVLGVPVTTVVAPASVRTRASYFGPFQNCQGSPATVSGRWWSRLPMSAITCGRARLWMRRRGTARRRCTSRAVSCRCCRKSCRTTFAR